MASGARDDLSNCVDSDGESESSESSSSVATFTSTSSCEMNEEYTYDSECGDPEKMTSYIQEQATMVQYDGNVCVSWLVVGTGQVGYCLLHIFDISNPNLTMVSFLSLSGEPNEFT